MQTRSYNTFLSLHTEGSLLPADLLQRVLSGDKDLGGLAPADYHLPEGEKLNEAVNRSWNRLQGAWATFQTSKSRLKEGDPGTTLTRERWLLPLFQELGYGRLATVKAIEIEGKAYPISHGWANVPIHLVGCGIDLDRRAAGVAGASKSSPHSLVQELLNQADDRQWGIASNGLRLRILRDNASLTRQAFLEFDLEAMFEGEVYADFVLLWLFCHQSRFESGDGKTEGCWLEKWSKAAQERGTRALDQLRNGVEDAIKALGSGFLAHPANQGLRAQLRSGKLPAQDYYRQLLRLVYRLIFLFAAEDRELLLEPRADTSARDRYLHYYSTARLRRLAERQRGGRHTDLWQGLRLITDILGNKGEGSSARTGLGLPILNGFLFSEKALPDLEASQVDNQALLTAIRKLAFTEQGNSRRVVDYKNLGPEELGSVYESLLELHPLLNSEAGTFELTSASGHERKTTGSYYTPTSLIQVLLDSALDPVIEQAVKNAGPSSESQQSALLNLKVCDPACGSGHFLIAAAHRIADKMARLRSEGDEPSVEENRKALRQVIAHCIYGVDVNPMAVELCKVNLWLESIEPGKPLSFLDAHIQCGDSLVGVSPGLDIREIPDEAFNPAFGDDKDTASALRKRNKAERAGQIGLEVFVIRDAEDLSAWMAHLAQVFEALPEETPDQVFQKARSFEEYSQSPQYKRRKLEADLWTASFFWKMEPLKGQAGLLAPTQEMLYRVRNGGTIPPELEYRVKDVADELKFLHWELAFPQVFVSDHPGFDCILGNPPWEMLQLDPREYFSNSSEEITNAPNMAIRDTLIKKLIIENPKLHQSFLLEKHKTYCYQKYIHSCNRYPLTSFGRINLMALFSELSRNLINGKGIVGIIVPDTIATNTTTSVFFRDLVRKGSLKALYGFKNERFLFKGIEHTVTFSLLIFSGMNEMYSNFECCWLAWAIEEMKDPRRRLILSAQDVELINPNTNTLPIFLTEKDANLTRKIYRNYPVLVDENRKINLYGFRNMLMFMMNTDSKYFINSPKINHIPLLEAKLIHQYDHHWAKYSDNETVDVSLKEKKDPNYQVVPKYWISQDLVDERLTNWEEQWLLGYREIARATDERTAIFCIVPRFGAGHKIPIVFLSDNFGSVHYVSFLANANSLIFDYVTRQKVGGTSISLYILKQLPVINPNTYSLENLNYIIPRGLELIYTAWDLFAFADSLWKDINKEFREILENQCYENVVATSGGHQKVPRPEWAYRQDWDGFPYPPFKWDEERRALLRAELDAYYARLYGLNHKQLRYILDPADLTPKELEDILDPFEEVRDAIETEGYAARCTANTFPGETFRVLKERELKQFGEYRTRRLVLEAWDRLEGMEIGNPGGYTAGYRRQDADNELAQPFITIPQEKKERKPAAAPKEPIRPVVEERVEEENPIQPSFTDFGLYKCEVCGKMVMGFDRDTHVKEKHEGRGVEWRKVK